MLTLSATAIAEKNALAAAGAWMELAEITLPGDSTPSLRYASNTEDVYWPSGQNLLLRSNDLSVSPWTVRTDNPGYGTTYVTFTRTAGVASWDGTNNATSLVFSAVAMGQMNHVYQDISETLYAGVRYVVRLKAKRTSGTGNHTLGLNGTGISSEQVKLLDFSADSNDWRTMEIPFTPVSDCSDARVYLQQQYTVASTVSIADAEVRIFDALMPFTATTTTTQLLGVRYSAFPFTREDFEETGKGGDALLRLRVGNVDGAVQAYMEANAGLIGASVRLMLVHSKHLTLTTPEIDQEFSIMSSSSDAQWAYFDLGADSPMGKRVPRARLLKNFCRWKFKGAECTYAGATATCNKTISACRAMDGGSNSARFGGFPGVGRGGFYG